MQHAAVVAQEPPEVRVRWRRLPAAPGVVDQLAREIVEISTGHPQPRVDAPVVCRPAGLAPVGTGGSGSQLSQAEKPISYTEAREGIAGVVWSNLERGVVELVGNDGATLRRETSVHERSRLKLARVTKPRRPMTVHLRPGQGGRQSRFRIDPYAELEQFPPAVWRGVPGYARVGVIELNPHGNAAGCARLSGEDNETLLAQIEPIVALEKRYPKELQLRYLLLAVNMSGTREVRPDRAAEPSDGTLERNDMLLLDSWIAQGWLRHVIWRDGDRIARDSLPGETLLKRWEKTGVTLWLATYGRAMDYRQDRLQLRAMMMVSAEERDNVTRRLGLAKVNKGPLAGIGWGSLRLGFYREPLTRQPRQDIEQAEWILKAFQYAASGQYLHHEGLSVRKVAEQLAREGFPISDDRLRVILRDPIYVTGEWTQTVRGVPVAQKPIELELPVPMTLYQTVQNLLALRKGATKNTPLGEYLLNYVHTVHTQCQDERKERKLPPGKVKVPEVDPETYLDRPRLRGVVHPGNPDVRRLRHNPFVPECCASTEGRGYGGAWTWENEWLEPPIVEAIRELAQHPAVMHEAAVAARHEVANSSPRLTEERRREIQKEISNLEVQQAQLAETQIARAADGRQIDFDAFETMHARLGDRITALQTQFAADAVFAASARGSDGYRDRVAGFLELLTVETPEDPFHKAMRARLFQKIVSKVEIDDDGNGPIMITLYGPLVPPGTPLEVGNPVLEGADLVDAYEDWKTGRTPKPDAEWNRVQQQIETALSSSNDKSVWSAYSELLQIAGQRDREAMKRAAMSDCSWRKSNATRIRPGEPSWRRTLAVVLESTAGAVTLR